MSERDQDPQQRDQDQHAVRAPGRASRRHLERPQRLGGRAVDGSTDDRRWRFTDAVQAARQLHT